MLLGGRYELVRPLCAGAAGPDAIGPVHLVRDRRTWELLAGKVVPPETCEAAALTEQAVRIRHPHVVAPRVLVELDDRLLVLMDLVRGGSAEDLLVEHGPLPAGFVAVVMDHLLAALAECHRAGVVHRDVKTANVLLEPGPPFARLADFGHAALRDSPRPARDGATPGYQPPESVDGRRPEPGQDLYAAGVLGLRLLTALPAADAARHVEPGPLGTLLSRLAAADPFDRPADARTARALLPQGMTATGPQVPDRIGVENGGRRVRRSRSSA